MRLSDTGNGPAVLLLHGVPSPSTAFAPVVELLSKRHRVLVPDLPGYRGEPALTGADRFGRTTAALLAELDARQIDRTAIIGFSGGAYRAVAMACEQPDRVSGLFLLGGYVSQDEGFRAGLRELAQLLRAGVDLSGGFPALMLSPGFSAAHPEAVAEVKKWLDLSSIADLADEFDSFVEAPDYGPAFSRLKIPITLRTGALDRPAFVEEARKAANLNPAAKVQIVEGCGHALLMEDRANTLAAITAAIG